jgi:hypothetical protein
MGLLRKLRLLIILFVLGSLHVSAQTAVNDDQDFQTWQDVQVSVPINKELDLFLQGYFRFGGNATQLTEGRGGLGLVWKVNKAFSISPLLYYGQARNTAGNFKQELRYTVRGTYKFPTKKFGLSHRSLFEYRVRSVGNSFRYRPSLTVDKTLPEHLLSKAKIYATEEPFYVSTTHSFSTNRFTLGVSKSVSSHLTLDIYYLQQNNGYSHPGDYNVVASTWRLRL